MKFCHSERVFHKSNFNPPCNYYDIKQNKIKQSTLTGDKIDKNTFGFQQRFTQNLQKIKMPGPTEYFMDKKQIAYQFKKDLSKPKSFLKNTFRAEQPSTSIPYKKLDINTLNDEQKKFLKELSLLQNIGRAVSNVHKKQPCYSFSKSPRGILPSLQRQKPHIHNSFKNQLEKINEFKVLQNSRIEKQQQQKIKHKNMVVTNEIIKKATKKRNQIINSIGPDFIPSLQLIELMKRMREKQTPGPGAYTKIKQNSMNVSFDIEQTNIKGNAFNNVKRFQDNPRHKPGPGSYNLLNEPQSAKVCILSKQKRNLFNMKQQTDIYHRFYIDPSIQSKNTVEPLFGKAQRSSSCQVLKKKINNLQQHLGAFGSSSKRFSIVSTVNCEQDKTSVISQFEQRKKDQFKQTLKQKIKKLHSQDRYSTKQDSGLLGISTMALNFD